MWGGLPVTHLPARKTVRDQHRFTYRFTYNFYTPVRVAGLALESEETPPRARPELSATDGCVRIQTRHARGWIAP